MGYYVYKYVENKEPVYVGKTTELDRRIKAHTKDKLASFHGKIYYFECPNETAMNSWEYCLINKYHPKYNVALKRADTVISIEEPEWIEYKKSTEVLVNNNLLYFPTQKVSVKKPIINRKQFIFRCNRCRENFKSENWRKTKKGYSADCPFCQYAVWIPSYKAK